jgi:hypothetical protein
VADQSQFLVFFKACLVTGPAGGGLAPEQGHQLIESIEELFSSDLARDLYFARELKSRLTFSRFGVRRSLTFGSRLPDLENLLTLACAYFALDRQIYRRIASAGLVIALAPIDSRVIHVDKHNLDEALSRACMEANSRKLTLVQSHNELETLFLQVCKLEKSALASVSKAYFRQLLRRSYPLGFSSLGLRQGRDIFLTKSQLDELLVTYIHSSGILQQMESVLKDLNLGITLAPAAGRVVWFQ